MPTIAVVDYGMGNLRSVAKALEHAAEKQHRVVVTSSVEEVQKAERIVFPGQGAARDCMKELEQRGLVDVVLRVANEKPFLGICMGLQVLMDHSEENEGTKCMGLYAGDVCNFANHINESDAGSLKIPHMGWNRVEQLASHDLWSGIEQGSRFYFVHSYFVKPGDDSLRAGITRYGTEFTSAIARENLFAVQFHPEKSARDGLRLLHNFCRWHP